MNHKSEIYALGYEKWEGDRKPVTPAWVLIGTAGAKNVVSSSGCLARFAFIGVFFIYYFLLIGGCLVRYQMESLKQSEELAALVDVFSVVDFQYTEAEWHGGWIVYFALIINTFVMLFYGSQLISKDRAANALQVYFSKSLNRFDYMLGKFFSIGIFTSISTLLPSALILILGLMLSTNRLEYLSQAWFVPFLSIGFWLIITFFFGCVGLFFSSLFNKNFMAGVGFLGFFLFCAMASSIMEIALGSSAVLEGLNLYGTINYIGHGIFELGVESVSHGITRGIVSLVLCASLLVITTQRIKPVEVVS